MESEFLFINEQLAVNETVQEVLYMMQAIRNGWIYEERKNLNPMRRILPHGRRKLRYLPMRNLTCPTQHVARIFNNAR